MHGGEQAAAENTCDAQHKEGASGCCVYLEHQHEVEGGRCPGALVREGTLTNG